MKYFIAVKPCGCPSGASCSTGSRVALGWGEVLRKLGYAIQEVDVLPDSNPLGDCPHGSVAEQLAAKLKAAEAERAELLKWLREQVSLGSEAVWAGGGTHSLSYIAKGRASVFRDVIAHIERRMEEKP